MFGYRLRDGSEAWPWKHRGPERSHENQRGDRVMMNLFTSVWLSFPSTRWNYFSVTAFQALGHQTVQNEAPQPKQEAVPADTEQQRLVEEQQRRQEAVLQKDRVGLASVTASSSCLIRLNWMRFNFGSTCPSNSFGSKFSNVPQQGNAYFKEGKYEAAVQCYSQGMEADGLNVLLPANRAMAFLKLEK